MNRFMIAAIGALPIVTFSLLPKPASAEAVPQRSFARAPIVVADRDDNDRRDNDWRNNDRRDNDRRDNQRRDNDWRNNFFSCRWSYKISQRALKGCLHSGQPPYRSPLASPCL